MPKKGTTNNPTGRPKGVKSERILAWDNLKEDLLGRHTEAFNAKMAYLAKSNDPEEVELFLSHYSKILQYFKPRMQATQHSGDASSPIIIQIAQEI